MGLSPNQKRKGDAAGSSGSSISLDVFLLGVGLIVLTAEGPEHERAKLFERIEASRRARRDVLHAASDVSGIRVGGELHDEGAA